MSKKPRHVNALAASELFDALSVALSAPECPCCGRDNRGYSGCTSDACPGYQALLKAGLPHLPARVQGYDLVDALRRVSTLYVGEPPEKPVDEKLAGQLAAEFCKVLKEWLTPEQWTEMVQRNQAFDRERKESGICASHDFCDANMAMQEAFHNLKIVAPFDDEEQEEEHYYNCELWNRAWVIARKTTLVGKEE